jgi:hypothetical protein
LVALLRRRLPTHNGSGAHSKEEEEGKEKANPEAAVPASADAVKKPEAPVVAAGAEAAAPVCEQYHPPSDTPPMNVDEITSRADD